MDTKDTKQPPDIDPKREELVRQFRDWKPKPGLHWPSVGKIAGAALKIVAALVAVAVVLFLVMWAFNPDVSVANAPMVSWVKGLLPVTVQPTFDNDPSMHSIDDGLNPIYYRSDPQFVRTAVNAVPCTPDEIQQVLDRDTPVLAKPELGGYAPKLSMIFPLDVASAQKVGIVKGYDGMGRGSPAEYHTAYCEVYAQGKSVPFYVPLIDGASTVDIKAMAMNPKRSINDIVLDYVLKDGQQREVNLYLDSTNFAPAKALTDSPTYGMEVIKRQGDASWIPSDLPTKEFDLSSTELLDLFDVQGSMDIEININSVDPAINGQVSFVTNGSEKLLYAHQNPP